MKKILGIVSLIIVVIFSFAACNNNEQKENNNNNSIVENNQQQGNNQQQDNNVVENNNNSENTNIVPFFSGEVITEPMNQEFNVASALNNIAEVSNLPESTKLSEAEINEEFDFKNFSGLQKEIRSVVTDKEIREIVIVKIGENDHSMPLFQLMTARMMKLKEKYEENEEITAILNNNENYVLKQQGGILISILAKNDKEIE
ncbi:MAG: hypothetical protein J6C46_08410, partial [Clostridia bacterium]|nr:hypothetical protein [Clostridia bacterium]